MMDPHAEVYAAVMTCIVPVLVAMFGALLLGTLVGLSSAAPRNGVSERTQTDLVAVRAKLAEVENRLSVAGSVMNQRLKLRDDEHALRQRELEKDLNTANAEIGNLKLAVAAAKRPLPPTAPATDTRHVERMAQLEQEAGRVPGLVQALDAAKAQLGKVPKKPATKKNPPLPEQVYRVMSASFGKRIQQDDLKLVEGIGPKIAEHLGKHGLKTWNDVAATKPAQLKKVLDAAGDRFQLHDPNSWPEQCRLMVENRWEELRKYQRKLSSAR